MHKKTSQTKQKKDVIREQDRVRQQRLTNRRNEEGRRLVKLYLHDATIRELMEVAEKSLYPDISKSYQGRVDDLSKLVSYCIRLATIEDEDEFDSFRGAQALLHIQQIVKARKEGFKTKAFELEPQSIEAIKRFMNRENYPTIDDLRNQSKKRSRWKNIDVEFCLNDKLFYEVLKQHNQELELANTLYNNPVTI